MQNTRSIICNWNLSATISITFELQRKHAHTHSKPRKTPDHLLLISAFCHRLDGKF